MQRRDAPDARAADRQDPERARVSVSNANERDPRVDDYIAGLPDWQRRLCEQLRDLVHAAEPEIAETVKRKVLPYFVLQGNVCALFAAKDHVNLFLYDGAIVPDPDGHHHIRPREQDGADDLVSRGGSDQCPGADDDAPPDRR